MPERTIRVTARDIWAAEDVEHVDFPAFCPVARAIKRAMRGHGYTGADVRVRSSQYEDGTAYVEFEDYGPEQLPDAAADFVDDFDNGRSVEPFSFTMWTPA